MESDEKCETYPTLSPQVGSISPSHIKLPTKAQTAETKSVAGTKTDVASITGFTNTFNSHTWTYATSALSSVNMTSMGTVLRRTV